KDQPEQDRDAEAVKQPRDDITPLIIGAEPVPFDVLATAIGFARLQLSRRRLLALLLREHPCWRRRRRQGHFEIMRVVGIADRRPDRPAVSRDLAGNDRVAVVGLREKAAEFFFRVVFKDRKEKLALVGGDDRLIVADEFGKQGDDEQNGEYPERIIAAPIA